MAWSGEPTPARSSRGLPGVADGRDLAITACADGAVRAWSRSGELAGLWLADGAPRELVVAGDRIAMLDDSTTVVILARD